MQGPYWYKLIGKKLETLFIVLYLDPNFEEEKKFRWSNQIRERNCLKEVKHSACII